MSPLMELQKEGQEIPAGRDTGSALVNTRDWSSIMKRGGGYKTGGGVGQILILQIKGRGGGGGGSFSHPERRGGGVVSPLVLESLKV